MSCNSSFDFLLELFNCTITYVDSDISAKRVGENNAQLFPQHCTGDDALLLPIVKWIANTTILSIMDGQPLGCQTPARTWESLRTARNSKTEMVFHMPIMSAQLLITILLPNVYRQHCNYTMQWWTHAFKSSKRSLRRGLSGSSDTSKLSETMFFISLLITSPLLLLIRMWIGYTSTIKM